MMKSINLLWFIIGIISLFLLLYSVRKFVKRRWLRLILYVLSFLLSATFFILSLFPFNKALEPTGGLDVETSKSFVSYKVSGGNYKTSGDEREVPLLIWKPKTGSPEGLFFFPWVKRCGLIQ